MLMLADSWSENPHIQPDPAGDEAETSPKVKQEECISRQARGGEEERKDREGRMDG